MKKVIKMKIDGVFSGGGMRGVAFIGALEELEHAGISFERVAGTSAGTITAAFIAARFTSNEMREAFQKLNKHILRDEGHFIKRLPLLKWLHLYKRLGFYKGNLFEQWISEQLATKGIYSFGDLPEGVLKIVAADLTNGEMIVIPDDLKKYQLDANTSPISKAVRMSCSLPFYYEPIYLVNEYRQALIVDGGILSNFPLWIFSDSFPKRPVVGFKICSKQGKVEHKEIKNGVQLVEKLFKTMRDAHDQRYIDKQIASQIVFLPVADLVSTMEEQVDTDTFDKLIEIGRTKTKTFLNNWSRVW